MDALSWRMAPLRASPSVQISGSSTSHVSSTILIASSRTAPAMRTHITTPLNTPVTTSRFLRLFGGAGDTWVTTGAITWATSAIALTLANSAW
jgi:hypothetical protein|tara:strand:+ start:194 stop:472 length:279 start_codon:yes stop_codon:yes gene_type:complete